MRMLLSKKKNTFTNKCVKLTACVNTPQAEAQRAMIQP